MNKLLTTTTAALLVTLSTPLPSMAGNAGNALQIDSGNEQNNETVQENVGIVNQTTSYSVGQASTYRIDSVVCPAPAFIISGNTSGGSNYDGSYALSASLVVPLGGRVHTECTEAFSARSLHYQVQNEVAISKECSGIISAGVVLSEEQFPILYNYCQGVATTNDSTR